MAKKYEVVKNFAGTIGKDRVFFTRRNQDDVAKMSPSDRTTHIENGNVREYDAGPDDERAAEPLERATSVPMELREEQEKTRQTTGGKQKKTKASE